MRIALCLLISLFVLSGVYGQTLTPTGPVVICSVGGTKVLTVSGAAVGTTFQWQVGLANIPGANAATYTATAAGSYTVILTVGSVNDTLGPVVITTRPPPTVNFTFNNNSTCSGTSIQFTSAVVGGTAPFTYAWDFGDAGTSNVANPTHAYTSLGCGTGIFNANLTVTDAVGCQVSFGSVVSVKQKPDVSVADSNLFSPFSNCDNDPTPANANYNITVNNTSINAGCISSYTLDWGDGVVLTGIIAADFPLHHTYTQLGAFNLIITALGTNGCSNSKTYVVANQSNPDIGIGTFNTTTGCAPLPVSIIITTWQGNSPGTTYLLNYGDGNTTSLTHPINPGYTNDTLIHNFTTTSCPGSPAYQLTITATNACRSKSFNGGDIIVKTRPQADFSIISTPSCVGQNVCFTNLTAAGYNSNCSTVTQTNWNFGDPTSTNNTSTAVSPCHVYANPGTYTVTLSSGNSCGISTSTKEVCIAAPPTPAFTINNSIGCAPLAVNTINTSVITNSCSSVTYLWSVSYVSGFCGTSSGWSFTNGTDATSQQPSFLFTNSGTYTITLALTNPCGTFTTTQVVTVKKPPTVTLSPIANACAPAIIHPVATVTNCGTATPGYVWTFTGGTPSSSTLADPGNITYNTAGAYTISLSVTNECGTTTVSTPVTVNPTPVPVVPANIVVCKDATIGPLNFTSTTAGATFTWTNSNTAIGLASSGSLNNIPAFTALNTTTSPLVATITVTAALNGCSSQNTFTITVNPKPLAPVAPSPVSYCQNAIAVPLTATAASGNTLLWYTVATGGTGSATAPTPLTTTVGSTTYYVSQTITATGCEGPRTPVTVVINPGQTIASATFINPATCSSLTGSITLNGLTPGTTYIVSYTVNTIPVTVNITTNAAGVLVIPNLGAGLYANISVSLSGCPSNQVGPFNLIDPSAPAMPVITTNSPLCAGNTLNLSASTTSPGTATYTWTGPNGFTSGVFNPSIPNVTVAASGNYNVTVTISGCTSPVASAAVVINPTPATPVAGSNSPLCGAVGLSLNLTASTSFPGAVSYSWTGPNGFTSSLQNPVIPGVTVTDAGVYTVIATANTGNCPSAAASTTVIVNPTPTISSSSFTNPSNCASATGSIALNGLLINTPYVINYVHNTVPQTITISSNASGTLTIPGLTAGSYTNLVVVLNGCPSAALSFTLTDPNPPATPVPSSNSPVCSGGTLNLQTAAVAGATYTWAGPNGFTSNAQNPTIPNVTVAASGTYTLSITVNSCTSALGSVSVLINQTPATPAAGSNSPLCSNVGATLNLNASTTTVGTITYAWTGPNAFSSSLQNPTIPNVTTAMSGTYTVTATGNPGNCISAATNVIVLVNPTPVIAGTTHTDPTNCGSATGSITLTGLTANTTYTVNYTWNTVPQTTSILSSATGTVLISGLAQGTYANIVVVLAGCPSAAVGPVVLADPNPPAAPTASSNSPICSGATLTLSASTSLTGIITYAWTGPNGFTSSLQNPTIPNVTTAASGIYNVSLTINDCVSAASLVTVLINPLPAAPVVTSPVNYCIGTTASALTANSLPGNTLNWYTTATGGTASTIAPVPSTAVAGSTDYYVSQVTTATGCEGQRSLINVIINPDAIADFRPVDTIKCPPFNISSADIGLQTYPANNSVYEWYVDGIFIGTGTVFPGYTILNEDDTVTVKLKAISLFGCKPDSISHQFYTYKLPHPSFTLSDTVGCGPLSVLVLNTTPNAALFTYTWNFGNGQTSTLQQPGTILFPPNPNSGDTTYIVSLSIFSICDTITVTDSIRVKAKPKALFTPSRTVGCSPMRVVFNNTSHGINNIYYWDFGDGTTAITNNLAPIDHIYNTGVQDTFYIKLVAVNECGSDSITYSVIAAPNNINLNLAVNGPNIYGCAPHTVAFYNNSPGATSFNWDFGDGNTLNTIPNTDTVFHTYLVAGTYTVSLTGQNSCTDTTTTLQITVFPKPTAAFTADRYTACIGDAIQFTNQSSSATSYLWQFGDGYTSTLASPSHSYTAPGLYTVKLIIYRVNAPGNVCIDSTSQQVQIVSSLPGSFTMSATTATCVPFDITFVNQNRPSVTSVWDFGDGNFGTGDSVVHTYLTAGVYIVRLTVTVAGGCTYTSQATVTLNGPSGTLQYTGGFKCYPDPVRLEAVAVNTNNLLWNFGDGNTLSTTQLVVFHNYSNPGIYIPSVTLQNTAGCNYFIQGLDTIKVDKIDAGFTIAQQKYCGSTNVVFTDTSHIFFGGALVEWDFGDGTTGTGNTINHVYTITGLYTVQMIVTGNSGCTDTVIKQINVVVNNKPVADIAADAVACTNLPVLFTGVVQSTDAINILQWTISNGVSSAGANLTYTFATAGSYLVTLITGTVNGCYDTAYHTITINPSPVVNATASLSLCLGNSVQLNATGAPQYQWSPNQGLSCTNCANPIATPVITTPYIVTGTNAFGCSGYDTVNVTVIQPLTMTTSGNDTLCIGGAVNLLASGATSYIWSPAIGLNSTTISNPTASPVVTTSYRVVGYDGFNCFTDTAFIVVAVGQYPTVNLGPDKVLSTGTVFPLATTIVNGPVRTWLWTPDTELSCSDCPLPSALIKNDISYIVNIKNIYGCEASDTIKIKVFCTDAQVYIPNAFSPDGDGINDILMVRGKGIVTVKSFRVFNRWGEVVFERINFPPNNPAYGWNGKIKGIEGPPDVFVYTAEVLCENGTPYTYKGNVSLIK